MHITILNIGLPNFIKEAVLNIKPQIGPNTVIIGDFNILFSSIDMSYGKIKT